MEKKFMDIAAKEALKGLKKNHGGPFGAVIIQNNNVISKAHNEVIKGISNKKQVTEIQAYREKCLKLFKEWENKENKIQY